MEKVKLTDIYKKDDEVQSLSGSMGIEKERADYINKAVNAGMRSSKKVSDVITFLSLEKVGLAEVTLEELSLIFFQIGGTMQSMDVAINMVRNGPRHHAEALKSDLKEAIKFYESRGIEMPENFKNSIKLARIDTKDSKEGTGMDNPFKKKDFDIPKN